MTIGHSGGLRIAPPAPKRAADNAHGELELARIQRRKQHRLWRLELVRNELSTAAGVRVQTGMRLR